MNIKMSNSSRRQQAGFSLIEVLISMLILAFGLLSVGGMIAYAVQLPKMAEYRAVAVMVANGMIERMRANKGSFDLATSTSTGFQAGIYNLDTSYNGEFTVPALQDCTYPSCTDAAIATMDLAYTNRILRQSLPAGGMRIERDLSSGDTAGNMWIMWNEPSTFAALNPLNSDNCPAAVAAYTNPRPRCLYIRFTL
jgi:type IV pilus assembly protein PilV